MACLLIYCNQPSSSSISNNNNQFLNLHDTVDYVGMQTCRSCHANIYDTYIQTGMGQSFDHATKEKSAAVFDKHAVVYDKDLNFYYHPFWKDSSLYIQEYRLEGKDTTHSRIEKISYVIGSGQHTNSHLINENGYVYQAPITFYTQDGKWDMAPGFEKGASSRFSRIIATECMTCHNHLPKQTPGSQNKYEEVPQGIECERCHGPGELHVKEKMAGNIVDTSKYVDYTIVNPANLPVELEVDICQRCHLQGTAVLNEGKDFYDFRPGMPLNEVMNVFLPRYSNSHDKFIMASQADRMRLSKCFTVGKMSCTNCHDPHKSVKSTAIETMNQACLNCHNVPREEVCPIPMAERKLKNDDCTSCHMPKTGSIDIPHVRITDHYIGKPIAEEEKEAIEEFIGLACLTDDAPSDLLMAQGYIALYDKFVPEAKMLDSARYFLDLSTASAKERFKTEVHYSFTRNDYAQIVKLSASVSAEAIDDGWTAYRIGESYSSLNQSDRALSYFQKAVELRPYNLDFNNKLGTTYLKLKNIDASKKVFDFILSENKKQPVALNNRGFIYLLEGNATEAGNHYENALKLDPDYEKAWINKVGLLVATRKMPAAMKLLNELAKRFPQNQEIKQIKKRLSNS